MAVAGGGESDLITAQPSAGTPLSKSSLLGALTINRNEELNRSPN